ncbi:Ig-like domain-containing protein [Singulisphaera sp. Ch08]|uniref:Ig-like domain-containing protein n=1 Tax=Singulisphaera sp. Ch08 TaxID=3120278 RepID=A0AAU7CNH5_9BACT
MNGFFVPGRPRKHGGSRTAVKEARRARVAIERLEGRMLLAYSTIPGSYVVNGAFIGTVSIQGNNNADSLVIANDTATNLLTHTGDDNTGGGAGQFADQYDWDSATPGSQHLAANSGTTLSFIIGAGAVTHDVTLGTPASPASGFAGTRFTNLAGPVGATRTITVDDSTGTVQAAGANAYSIALNTGPNYILSGPNFQLNETAFANGGVTLKGGTAANTFNLVSTFAGEPVHLVGGSNNDTFNIRGMSGTVTVDGNGGADSAVVGNAGSVGGINGSLSVSDTGGAMALEVNDSASAGARVVAIGASAITGLTNSTLTYANLSSLRVDTGSGADTVTVNATPAVTTLNTGAGGDTVNVLATTSLLAINGQNGADTVNVGNAGNAQSVQAALTVSNTNGSTSLNINNSADAVARSVNVGASTITGLIPGTITFSNLSHLRLDGGLGGNVFAINDPSSGDVTVNAGGGDDTVNVLALNTAPLVVDGQGGTNSVRVGSNGNLAGIQAGVSVTDTGGTTALIVDDSNSGIGRTYDVTGVQVAVSGLAGTITFGVGVPSLTINAGSGEDAVSVDASVASSLTTLSVNSGAGSDSINLRNVNAGLTVNADTQAGVADVTTVGDAGILAGIQGVVNVSGSVGGSLIVDDSANAADASLTLAATQISSDSFTGAIHYFGSFSAVEVSAGSGGNLLTITDTGAAALTLVKTGTGSNLIRVLGTSSHLGIVGQGSDEVNIGDAGSLQSILGFVAVDGGPGAIDLWVDGSADLVGQSATLAGAGVAAFLTGMAPASISYRVSAVESLLIDGGDGDDTLTVDFSGGNPVPLDSLGYDGGNGSNTLNLQGGTFALEDYFGFAPGAGVILLDTSAVLFSNLLPINDVTHVVDFVFSAPPGTSILNLVDGPIFNGFQTAQFNSGAVPTFELMNFANKTNVTIEGAQSATSLTINNPTAADGLETLTLNTQGGSDQAVIIAAPLAVELSVNLAGGNDTTSVNGPGLAAETTSIVDGGPNFDTLTYDAGGASVVVTAGASPGEVLIARAGSGTLDSLNFEQITINNSAPVPPVVGPVQTLQGVEGTPIIDATLATFTSTAPGAKAADFLATITWGDGTTSAGTITQDAGDPSLFYITGTHTYGLQGTYVPAISIVSTGSSGTTVVNGVPVTTLTPPSGPVATTANVNVANAPLVVNVFSVTGTQGIEIPAGAIATFQDTGGVHPVGDYTATIEIVDSNNTVVVSVPAASIVAGGAAGSFLVNAPAFTLGQQGTYIVRVSVTDTTLPSPTTQTGTAQAIIDAAKLSATGVNVNTTEGQTFTGLVATFTDANPGSLASDFTVTILWGDGHQSLGTVTETDPGVFTVSGTNTYADAGSYALFVTIHDQDGRTVLAAATATVGDAALSATGLAISAAESQPFNGAVATFTDANPLATAADFTASIDWGDGSPISAGTISQAANGTFFVSGSHTYGAFTPIGSPHTVTVTIRDQGGASALATGSATVFSASLNSTGAAVSAVEGTPFSGLVATFTDSGGAKPAASYTVVIAWGDGTTSPPTTVTAVGAGPLGTTYTVNGSHTYANAGSYATKVTITSLGGSVTVATGSATVADAPLTAQVASLSATQGVALVNATVASFTDAGGAESVDHYSATINWGDGTPLVGGIIVSDGTTFRVLGTHKYLEVGLFTIGVTINEHGGAGTTAYGAINVAVSNTPLTLTGGLDPSSDSGVSQTDGITKVRTPTFVGTSQPGSTVRLFAVNAGQPTVTIPIGTTITDASGSWRITSPPLADGTYSIVATAVAQNGVTTATSVLPPLVIDTVGPTVSSLQFDPLHGQLFVGLQDNRSGLDQRGLHDGANFVFTKAGARPGRFLVTRLNVSPIVSGTSPQTVTVVVNGGRLLRRGQYAMTVLSRGLQDIAGNALDGEFYGTFPSGNGIPGSNFAARLDRIHNRVSAPKPFTTTASPNASPGTPGQPGLVKQPSAALRTHDEALATVATASGKRSRDGGKRTGIPLRLRGQFGVEIHRPRKAD